MKRSGFKPRAQTLSQRSKLKKMRVANPLKKNAVGASAVTKGPVRDKDHLARVRLEPCVICGRTGVEAHHARVGLRTMGVRKDDTKALPLCPAHHRELHQGREEDFWARNGIDPLAWCADFVRSQP